MEMTTPPTDDKVNEMNRENEVNNLSARLPELPSPDHVDDFGDNSYNADQMRDYAIAALSALPAGGEPVGEVYALGTGERRVHLDKPYRDLPVGTKLYTTPPADADVGAQGEDNDAIPCGQCGSTWPPYLLKDGQCIKCRKVAPAAGKGVDDAWRSIVYAALRSIRYNANNGSQDRPQHQRLHLIGVEAERAIAALEAALTRQPVAGTDSVEKVIAEVDRQLVAAFLSGTYGGRLDMLAAKEKVREAIRLSRLHGGGEDTALEPPMNTPTDDLCARQVIADAIKLVAGGSFNTPADVADWLRDELAALSALPAGGESVDREELLKDYLADYEFLGDDAGYRPNERERLLIEDALRGWEALDVCTTPPADADEALLTNPYTGTPRDYRDVESDPEGVLIRDPGAPLKAADADVGAQGDAVVRDLEAAVMLPTGWYTFVYNCAQYCGKEVNGNRLAMSAQSLLDALANEAAPAAGKGVDDAMRKRAREWLAANNGYWDDDYVERLLRAILPQAALTRQPEGKGVDELAEAVRGLRFDVYELTTPELRAAFDGKKTIAVVDPGTVSALKAALTRQPVAGDGDDAANWRRAMACMAAIGQSDKSVSYACALLLSENARKVNAGRAEITLHGITDNGEECGDWRITVEHVTAPTGPAQGDAAATPTDGGEG